MDSSANIQSIPLKMYLLTLLYVSLAIVEILLLMSHCDIVRTLGVRIRSERRLR